MCQRMRSLTLQLKHIHNGLILMSQYGHESIYQFGYESVKCNWYYTFIILS